MRGVLWLCAEEGMSKPADNEVLEVRHALRLACSSGSNKAHGKAALTFPHLISPQPTQARLLD